MQDCYRAGLMWLATSGIQAESGGMARYYEADAGRYKNVSTEITAYGLQGYLYLPLPGQTGLLSNALRAGQFLCYDAGRAEEGLFPFEITTSNVGRRAYFFDCGIIIRALVGLWHTTADPMYLERAERCGMMMLDRMSRVDGAFFPVLDMDSGVPLTGSGSDHWSLEPGPYQLKVGMGFLELAEVTNSGLFSKLAERLLQWSLPTQGMFLPADLEADQVVDRLHAYCYFLEGLLPFLDRHFECAQALAAGIARVETLIGENAAVLQRCDAIAQLLRLRLMADYMGPVELDLSAASREAESLPGFQMRTDDRRTNGAFCFGRRKGQLIPHANPTSTIFAMQALRMWNEYQRGEMRTTWHDIV